MNLLLDNPRLSPYQAYRKYLAIKLHFTSPKYDYFLSGGGVNATESSFVGRSDSYYFEKLSDKYRSRELTDYLFSNFFRLPNIWIGNLFGSDAERCYSNWQGRIQSFGYRFDQDCKFIKSHCQREELTFEDFITTPEHSVKLLQWESMDKIYPESLCTLNQTFGFLPLIRSKNSTNPLIEVQTKNLEKYSPYIWQRVSTPFPKMVEVIAKTFNLH